MSLADTVRSFPRKPGVYLFKDAKGAVLYVGKAKRLRDRVRSYFVPGRDERPQVQFLLRRTADIAFIVTDTEKEALLLENTLIKEHRPRYNIHLRDDKSYISIRIGYDHESPGIMLTRHVRKDGARYFGPYDSGLAAREAIDVITRFLQVRTCTDREFANRVRPCLKYDIGRCTAPCVGKISRELYAEQVADAEFFLQGHSRELIRRLERQMKQVSEEQRYEDAARLRDAIAHLKGLIEGQKVVRHHGGDQDAVVLAHVKERAAICVLRVRAGTLIGRQIFPIGNMAGDDAQLVEEFLLQHYREELRIPSRLLLSHSVEGQAIIAQVLSERRGAKVSVTVPQKGEKRRLVELALTNAREAIVAQAARRDESDTLDRVGRKLGLSSAPSRIECLDISNLQGLEAVGSLVSFLDGEPDKKGYRIYNIQTISTPDDYGMMHEVLMRRFAAEDRAPERSGTAIDRPLPDLLLVDGGKGQLAVAQRVLEELSLEIPTAAIAKGEKKGHADRIFIPGRKNPLNFKRGSKELLFLMRVRDEAHRFGITAHRRRHGKQAIASPLDVIPGLGPKRRKVLLDRFGGLDGVRCATVEEIVAVPGISKDLAIRIHEWAQTMTS